MGLKPVKLGKRMELVYLPFSKLVVPWDVSVETNNKPEQGDNGNIRQQAALTLGAITPGSLKTIRTIKQDNLDSLKASIGQFGLLKPLEVADLPEELGFFFSKGKYLIIDGQRRYFAIRELLRLATVEEERSQKEGMRTSSRNDRIGKAETQAQEQLEKLSIRDYVLVPCLLYPYKTILQMVRHNTESDRVSDKSSKIFAEIVEKMRQQRIPDLNPDDLSNLWETRNAISEEQLAIENTLQEIRTRNKKLMKT